MWSRVPTKSCYGTLYSCTHLNGINLGISVYKYFWTFSLTSALETAAGSGKPGLHDVRVLNVSLMSEINVVQEALEPPQPLSNLNVAKVSGAM